MTGARPGAGGFLAVPQQIGNSKPRRHAGQARAWLS
jgi:hypothetical protein